MDNIFIWLIIGLVAVFCVLPMLFMGKHKDKNNSKNDDGSGKA